MKMTSDNRIECMLGQDEFKEITMYTKKHVQI